MFWLHQKIVMSSWKAPGVNFGYGLDFYYYYIQGAKVAPHFLQKLFGKSTFFIYFLKIYVKIGKKCFGCIKK